jgi:hypothetical protein
VSTAFPFFFGRFIGFYEWSLILPTMFTSIISYLINLKLIPSMKHTTREAGLSGKDLNKSNSKEM